MGPPEIMRKYLSITTVDFWLYCENDQFHVNGEKYDIVSKNGNHGVLKSLVKPQKNGHSSRDACCNKEGRIKLLRKKVQFSCLLQQNVM